MIYIQLKRNGQLETVDECETRRHALYLVREYSISDPTGHYYMSARPCKGWRT